MTPIQGFGFREKSIFFSFESSKKNQKEPKKNQTNFSKFPAHQKIRQDELNPWRLLKDGRQTPDLLFYLCPTKGRTYVINCR